jgi:phosphoribosylformylglycinamidine synthase I
MAKPNAIVITAAGINCDLELAHAFELAGCSAVRVHMNRLIADPALLERYQLIGLPGGFSFGDAIAAGRIMAQLIRKHLFGPLMSAVERGVPIIAPCNGFQIAVQAGLLPGPGEGEPWPEEPARQVVTLAPNASSRFVDRWVRVEIPTNTTCIWTHGLHAAEDTSMLPVAHGEGRFVPASMKLIDQLDAAGQIAIRYAVDDNPNGSVADIAGICDRSGLIFGLMPHPERYATCTQHPFWTRLGSSDREGVPLGLAMFKQAVAFVEGRDARTTISPGIAKSAGDPQCGSPVRCRS